MASKLRTIRDSLISAIQLVNGAPSYDHDLSGADQVVHGRAAFPPRLPCLMIFGARSATTEENAQLGHLTRPHTWTLWGSVAAPSTAPGAGEAEAEDLFDDVCIAIMADPTLSGDVYDVKVTLDDTWGADLEGELLPGFLGTVTVLRETAYGAGT